MCCNRNETRGDVLLSPYTKIDSDITLIKVHVYTVYCIRHTRTFLVNILCTHKELEDDESCHLVMDFVGPFTLTSEENRKCIFVK